MIDMVFLLLIFFMCASQMSVMQNVKLEIPEAEKAVVPKERPQRYVINIKADGTLYGGSTQMAMTEIQEQVKAQREAWPECKIYLRADKETEHIHVKKVMGAMAEIGIDDFIFGAYIPN